jgi:hypothetical protein
MSSRIIVIDGKTFNSIDEMPPDIRKKYEQAMSSLRDSDNNRIPDAFENGDIFADGDWDGIPDAFENMSSAATTASSMKIIIDGKEFSHIEDLPPDARARYEQAMGAMDANKNGIPDFVEGMFTSASPTTTAATGSGLERPRRSSPLPVNPTITPDTSNGWMIMLAGLFIFLLCAASAGALWYFFLR